MIHKKQNYKVYIIRGGPTAWQGPSLSCTMYFVDMICDSTKEILYNAWFSYPYPYRVLYILYSRSLVLVPDVLNLVSIARITAVCSREPRGTENDILRLWLRRLRVDPNRKTELKILKVAPSSYHKYRGTKKFVPGYRESDELLVRIGAYSEVPRGSHGVVRNLL